MIAVNFDAYRYMSLVAKKSIYLYLIPNLPGSLLLVMIKCSAQKFRVSTIFYNNNNNEHELARLQ